MDLKLLETKLRKNFEKYSSSNEYISSISPYKDGYLLIVKKHNNQFYNTKINHVDKYLSKKDVTTINDHDIETLVKNLIHEFEERPDSGPGITRNP